MCPDGETAENRCVAKDPDQIVPPSKELRIVRGRVPEADRMVKHMAKPEWATGALLVKGTERSSVFRGRALGRELVVKCHRLQRWKDTASRVAGRTRLARQWHGAALLILANIPTAEPLVYWRGRDAEGKRVEALALAWVDAPTVLHVAARPPEPPEERLSVREEHGLARSLGALTAALVRAGLVNRDHKPSNVLAVRDGGSASSSGGGTSGGGWKLVLVDTVGVRALKGRDPDGMLANLYYEFGGTGTDVRRALLWRCVRVYADAVGSDAKVVWRKAARMVEKHGDMRPRDDPLEEGTRH